MGAGALRAVKCIIRSDKRSMDSSGINSELARSPILMSLEISRHRIGVRAMPRYRAQGWSRNDLRDCVARLDEQLADVRKCEKMLRELTKDRKDLISEIDLQIGYLKSLEGQIIELRRGIVKETQWQEK
jgi:hypothetical protein